MPTRLRKLRIDRVALVPKGANQEAHVLLYKAADTKRENGQDYPAAAYAYVPDSQSPSTWKLRLVETPGGAPTPAQVGRALAALGPGGFRGNRVKIPSADLAAVKRRVLAAWRATHDRKEEVPAVLKNDYGMHGHEEDDEGPPMTLEERQQSRALWQQWGPLWRDFCETVGEIMDYDEDDTAYADILMASIDQFRAQADDLLSGLGLLKKAAPLFTVLEEVTKAGAIMSAARKQRVRAAIAALQAILDEATPAEGDAVAMKGATTMASSVEEVTKRAEIAEAEVARLTKALAEATTEMTALKLTPEEQEAAYLKGLPDAVRKQFEADKIEKAALRAELQTERDSRLQQTYIEKTASYRALGLTPDHWNILKAVDALPEQERTELLRILASAAQVIKTSGVLKALGVDGGVQGENAEARAVAFAKAEQDKTPALGFADAIALVWKAHPDLYEAYSREKRSQGRV